MTEVFDAGLPAFLEEILRPEDDWELFELALHLGRIGNPALSFSDVRVEIAEIVSDARAVLRSKEDFEVFDAINRVLYELHKFRGASSESYYSPENSFIDQVLRRRVGIPITLSLLYREVARHLGLELECVGMPGHFLLGYRREIGRLFVDAFNAGELLVESECAERLASFYDGSLDFSPEFLEPASPRQVILRMLLNLKAVYRDGGNSRQLLKVLNRRIPLLEDPFPEILERGIVLSSMQHFRGALADFERFVENTPDGRMRELVAKQLPHLRSLAKGN